MFPFVGLPMNTGHASAWCGPIDYRPSSSTMTTTLSYAVLGGLSQDHRHDAANENDSNTQWGDVANQQTPEPWGREPGMLGE